MKIDIYKTKNKFLANVITFDIHNISSRVFSVGKHICHFENKHVWLDFESEN